MSVFVAVWAFVGFLSLTGCGSPQSSVPSYLSEECRLVGGGLNIHWQAPEAGTIYLMEKRTGKLIQTASLDAGSAYVFMIESAVRMENMLGISLSKAEFLLYFKPASSASPTP